MKTPQHNARATVRIEGLAHDGRGVARREGKAVFVAGALPGEEVDIRVTRSRERHDEAVMLSVLRASPDRTQPPCPHAGACGGCNLQHFSSKAQLASLQQRLLDTLERIGNVKPDACLEPVASAPWHYRARARLTVMRSARDGRVQVGFRQEESSRVEPITECRVLVPSLASLPARLQHGMASLKGPTLPQEIWLAAGDEGVAIGFCSRQMLSSEDRHTLVSLSAELGARCGFGALDRGQLRSWESPAPQLHYSPEPGLRLRFAPWDFTQANRAVNEILVSRVIEALAPTQQDEVVDFFCGIGNFSLPLARRARRVLGIEGNAQQVSAAKANAELNAITNCEFSAADLFQHESLRLLQGRKFNIALLDPPRAGAAELCGHLRSLGLRKVAYVSCDAATLARDAKTLCAQGFRLSTAGVFQMFPQTSHAEILAVFQR